MSFNDNDLKQLKIVLDISDDWEAFNFNCGFMPKNIKFLLARLEAVERLIPWLESIVEMAEERHKVGALGGMTPTEQEFRYQYGKLKIDEIKILLDTWRKSKGE